MEVVSTSANSKGSNLMIGQASIQSTYEIGT